MAGSLNLGIICTLYSFSSSSSFLFVSFPPKFTACSPGLQISRSPIQTLYHEGASRNGGVQRCFGHVPGMGGDSGDVGSKNNGHQLQSQHKLSKNSESQQSNSSTLSALHPSSPTPSPSPSTKNSNVNSTKKKKARRPASLTKKLQPRIKKQITLTTRQKSISQGRDPILSLNMNLDYLAKSLQKNGALRAEEMLRRIEALHEDGYYERAPDVCSYNCVMNAYALGNNHGTLSDSSGSSSSDKLRASDHAERLMARMAERGLEPNGISYNTWLRCIARDVEVARKCVKSTSRSNIDGFKKDDVVLSIRNLISKAESILSEMIERRQADTISYNIFLSILSKSQLPKSAELAEEWLQRMETSYETTGNEKIRPDVVSFNTVIHAYANEAHATLQKMQYSSSNQDDATITAVQNANRAEKLLISMEQLYDTGENADAKPDVVSYSTVVNAYAKAAAVAASRNSRTKQRDNNISGGFGKHGKIEVVELDDVGDECAAKAMGIMERMITANEKYDSGGVKPNKMTYTAVITAFAKIGRARVADDILSKMKIRYQAGDVEAKPDTICYSSVIHAYAKKGGEDAAERAEALLHEMENLYNLGDHDVKPNTRTYCAVITALGRSGLPRAAEKAEQILDEMEQTGCSGAPNTICYNAVIDAFARSKSVSKAYRAELLLERMLEGAKSGNASIRPDTISFNSVINAAAQSFGDSIVRKEAYLIGLNAFKTLHELDYCKPSSVTYVLFLKLLENLVETGKNRDYMAKKVFGLCTKNDLVNFAVISQLKKTCSPIVASNILASANVHIDVNGKTE